MSGRRVQTPERTLSGLLAPLLRALSEQKGLDDLGLAPASRKRLVTLPTVTAIDGGA